MDLGGDFLHNYPSDVFHMHNIEVVHTPYDRAKQMMNMERIFQHEDLAPIENVFRLAQYCAEYWKHRVKIVIHCSLSMEDFMEYELFRKRLVQTLAVYFEEYPQVDLVIENVVPMEYKRTEYTHPRLYNGIFLDTPLIAGYLHERFGNRIGTVLDICHAMMTEKYLTAFMREADFAEDLAEIDFSLDHYFRSNAELCRLIHFNDFIGNGYRRNHGTGFTSQEKVDGILDLYRKYQYNCPLTIEIREDDYKNCVNYRMTKGMIEEWENRNGEA
jgi:hypothetical protein